MTVHRALAEAERLLLEPPCAGGDIDPRWQALIDVADFVPAHPMEIWPFVRRWGADGDDDVRAAVATCLLEHLLEHHFETVFPLVEEAAADRLFADTFCLCWKFGRSELPANAARFDALRTRLAERRARTRRSEDCLLDISQGRTGDK